MKLSPRHLQGLASVLVLLALAGCSALPPAPRVQTGASADVSAAPAEGLLGGPPVTLPPPAPPGDSVSDEVARVVDGAVGQVVRNGDVTLRVPPGAFAGAAEIHVRQPDPARLHCQLEILPAEKNHFDVPVTLEFDVSKSDEDVRELGIFWWDPAQQEWVPVDSYANPEKKTVSAQLPHFSEYKVDHVFKSKAGW